MENKIMEKIRDWSILALSYLTISGIVYHLSFWGTFDLNGLSFITVGNILTSSIYPILSLNGIFYVAFFLCFLAGYSFGYPKFETPSKLNVSMSAVTKGISVALVLSIVAFRVLYDRNSVLLEAMSWLMVVIASLLFHFQFTENEEMKYLNTIGTLLVFYLPVGCLVAGKRTAEKIKTNTEYSFIIKNVGLQRDTLKFLGNAEGSFFFTDMKNEKVIYFKSDTLTLFHKDEILKRHIDRPSKPPVNP